MQWSIGTPLEITLTLPLRTKIGKIWPEYGLAAKKGQNWQKKKFLLKSITTKEAERKVQNIRNVK